MRNSKSFIEFSKKKRVLYFLGTFIQKLLLKPIKFDDLKKRRTLFKSILNKGYKYFIENDTTIIQINTTKINLRNGTSDLQVFEQIYIIDEYASLFDFIQINNICVNSIIDAGSNIGLSSLKFLEKFPNCKIICLEPDPQNFSALQKNLNHFQNSVIAMQSALWFKDDELYLDNSFRDSLEWSRSITESYKKNLPKIKAVSMNTIIRENNLEIIDLFKIDIEGSEAKIFKKENDLSFLNIVKIIVIEIHDEFDCREMIYTILKNYKFYLFNIGELTIGVNRNNLVA